MAKEEHRVDFSEDVWQDLRHHLRRLYVSEAGHCLLLRERCDFPGGALSLRHLEELEIAEWSNSDEWLKDHTIRVGVSRMRIHHNRVAVEFLSQALRIGRDVDDAREPCGDYVTRTVMARKGRDLQDVVLQRDPPSRGVGHGGHLGVDCPVVLD